MILYSALTFILYYKHQVLQDFVIIYFYFIILEFKCKSLILVHKEKSEVHFSVFKLSKLMPQYRNMSLMIIEPSTQYMYFMFLIFI